MEEKKVKEIKGIRQAPAFDFDIFQPGMPIEVIDWQEGKDIYTGIITHVHNDTVIFTSRSGFERKIYIEAYMDGQQEVRFFEKRKETTKPDAVLEQLSKRIFTFPDRVAINFPPVKLTEKQTIALNEWLDWFLDIQHAGANEILQEAEAGNFASLPPATDPAPAEADPAPADSGV